MEKARDYVVDSSFEEREISKLRHNTEVKRTQILQGGCADDVSQAYMKLLKGEWIFLSGRDDRARGIEGEKGIEGRDERGGMGACLGCQH